MLLCKDGPLYGAKAATLSTSKNDRRHTVSLHVYVRSLMFLNVNVASSSHATQAAPDDSSGRLLYEMGLFVGLLVWLFCVLAAISYSPADAAWSTTGHGQPTANWVGHLGALLADGGYFALGFSVWWLTIVSGYVWLRMCVYWLRHSDDEEKDERRWLRRVQFVLGLVLLLCASTALEWSRLHRFDDLLPGPAGGMLGYMVGSVTVQWLGFTGSGLVGIILLVQGVAWVFGFSWRDVAERLGCSMDDWILKFWKWTQKTMNTRELRRASDERQEPQAVPETTPEATPPTPPEPPTPLAPALKREVSPSELVAASPQPPEAKVMPLGDFFVKDTPQPVAPKSAAPAPGEVEYRSMSPQALAPEETALPQVDLLDAVVVHHNGATSEALEMTSRLIETKLSDFGVDVRVVDVLPGPVITRYEIEPATGVKGAQIVNLSKDLARSLSLVSIRVVETIPGKNTMALELPNARQQVIQLIEVLDSDAYQEANSVLTLALGMDIVGQPVVADLLRMPHCLVAGTTGSGKSVGINAMILSLLYKARPRDVRLMLIDPKMLELSPYEGIPHLLCPVVTDMKLVANGLNWCVAEMERRYRLLSRLGVRTLAGYNARIDEAQARGECIVNPFSLTPEAPEPLARLPYIVVVIDELADLMQVAGKKIEELIARLAQKARAAGIHLILATQRPSVNVITGTIKANIPTRIAYQVPTKIDSRTILDQMGAEALLGRGDMLFMASGTGLPKRVHGAYVSEGEVLRVATHLKAQGEPDYVEGVLEGTSIEVAEANHSAGSGAAAASPGDGNDGEKDAKYDEAVQLVLKERRASISYVQRKLGVGYNRSARMLEAMERNGLVSPLTTNGVREVLAPAPEFFDAENE